jgi:hypothetical protein
MILKNKITKGNLLLGDPPADNNPPVGAPTDKEIEAVKDAILKATGKNFLTHPMRKIYSKAFIDRDSIENTRHLIATGKLEETANIVLGSPLAKSVLSGEKPGFWDVVSSLGTAKKDIHKTLINMGVRPEDAVGYIKTQASQLGAKEDNLGYIDRLGGKGALNPLNFFDYKLPGKNDIKK